MTQRKYGRRQWIWLLALLFICTSGWARAMDIWTVDEVHEGMRGIAKTVVHGNTIRDFDVEVLGVLRQRGPVGDLILVRVSGDVIDQTGGIARGMSGSPVYIDGKLVGAIGYGWGFADGRIGMVTPIQDMLKLWTIEDRERATFIPSLPPGVVPLETPLMASGYAPESLQYMGEKLKAYHMVPYATGGATAYDQTKHPLEAGGAVAVSLVTGDLKLGAIGTVTYVDSRRVLAFGHPFLKRGNIGYFMHNSYIFTVVPSVESAFKIGSIGAEIGMINQDRGAGVAGLEGIAPKSVPMSVVITDQDTGNETRTDVRMVQDDILTPVLAATTAYDMTRKTIDRGGRGTARVSYTITSHNPKLKNITRTNMFYGKEISESAVDELYNVLEILGKNQFVDYDINQIDMKLELTEDKHTAEIVEARALPSVVSPGDDIYVRVYLLPYRGEKIHRDMVFHVPEDQPYGPMTLEVRGGGVVPLPYLIQKQQLNLTEEILERLRKYKDFEDLRQKIEDEDKNNQIVVEILENNVSVIDDDTKLTPKDKIQHKESNALPGYLHEGADKMVTDDREKATARLDTEYIVRGDGQFTFDVVPVAEKARRLRKEAALLKAQEGIAVVMEKEQASKQNKSDAQSTKSRVRRTE